jgi:uncharacterized metal-binding protein
MTEYQKNKTIIIPCSGIGKAFGTVGREATYLITEELAKEKTDTTCLPLLLIDEEARKLVNNSSCITIDGCPLACAKKNVEFVGGQVQKSFQVLEVIKKNRGLRTKEITQIDENGKKIARILAEEVRRELEKTESEQKGNIFMRKQASVQCNCTSLPQVPNERQESFSKVGIVSCSGENCIEGTLSRIATRITLEKLRPYHTVTICLPLCIAGGLEERMFTNVHPTITVDGCSKKCAKRGTEMLSGRVIDSVVITELLDEQSLQQAGSRRELNPKGMNMAFKIAEEVAKKVDTILGARKPHDSHL